MKMHLQLINSFHGTATDIRPGVISARRAKDIWKRLCGMMDCICSGALGVRGEDGRSGVVNGTIYPSQTPGEYIAEMAGENAATSGGDGDGPETTKELTEHTFCTSCGETYKGIGPVYCLDCTFDPLKACRVALRALLDANDPESLQTPKYVCDYLPSILQAAIEKAEYLKA